MMTRRISSPRSVFIVCNLLVHQAGPLGSNAERPSYTATGRGQRLIPPSLLYVYPGVFNATMDRAATRRGTSPRPTGSRRFAMKAVRVHEFGGPEALILEEAP